MQKKTAAKDHSISKSLRMEKEKRDYFRKKWEEKYASVLSKKKDFDNTYELKMKELARRVTTRARGANVGPKASASSKTLAAELVDIPLKETGWEEVANKDVVDPLQQTAKNVNFELARQRSGSTTQMLSRTHLGQSAMSMRPGPRKLKQPHYLKEQLCHHGAHKESSDAHVQMALIEYRLESAQRRREQMRIDHRLKTLE